MNWISLVNEWCQKNSKPHPKYTFNQHDYDSRWRCEASADWLEGDCDSGYLYNKNDAKFICAKNIYEKCKEINKIKITCPKGTCIMIDGDQRADCWKWLASEDTHYENLAVKVYTSPTAPIIASNKDIEHIPAKTTSKDAADAHMLMDLGGFLATKAYQRFVLVSSDHILVQAAMDTHHVESAANLAQLKSVLWIN